MGYYKIIKKIWNTHKLIFLLRNQTIKHGQDVIKIKCINNKNI